MLNVSWRVSGEGPVAEEWDGFMQSSPRGHYLQLTPWLRAYSRYGFGWRLLTAHDHDTARIVSGMGVVIVRSGPFSCCVCPAGPVVREGYEFLAGPTIEHFREFSRRAGAVFCQLNTLARRGNTSPYLLDAAVLPQDDSARAGVVFKEISMIDKLRLADFSPWNNLEGENWAEAVMNSYSIKKRCNIRRSLKNNLELRHASTPEEIRNAYACIEDNAETQGYNVRRWSEFGPTVIDLVARRQAVILMAGLGEAVKGAILLIRCGRRFTYLMGGATREKPDLKVGTFLQWHAIRLSRDERFSAYDMTPGGSPGVVEFKESFNAFNVDSVGPRYWVFRPLMFGLFRLLYPRLRKHRAGISNAMSSWRAFWHR